MKRVKERESASTIPATKQIGSVVRAYYAGRVVAARQHPHARHGCEPRNALRARKDSQCAKACHERAGTGEEEAV